MRPMGRAMVCVLVALLCGRDGALLAPRPVRAPMRLRAAADVAALEAASLEALGCDAILEHLRARCAGARGRALAAAPPRAATVEGAAALYAETVAARDARPGAFLGADVGDGVLDAARSGAGVGADDLRAAADASEAVAAAAAWARALAPASPLRRLCGTLAADADGAVDRDLLAAFEVEDSSRTAVLDGGACAAVGAARRAVAEATAALGAAVAAGRETADLFEVEKDRWVATVPTATPPRSLGRKRGASRSGKSSYVEPAACGAAADALEAAAANAAAAEAARLGELAARLGARAPGLRRCLEAIAAVDYAAARAALGFEALNGVVPALVGGGGGFATTRARHPLLVLDGADAVGSDLGVGAGGCAVFTGPNGGGKTVALKTLGVFADLVRIGVPLPADAAAVPVYGSILADIDGSARAAFPGASTYEAHLSAVAAALDVDAPALVLFDELGSGTAEAEGGALAVAALEALAANNATVACATHHAALKAYAVEARASSYAVAGGEATPGPPGRSDALAAARRRGVPPALVARAGALVGGAGGGGDGGGAADGLWAALEVARAAARARARGKVFQRSPGDRSFSSIVSMPRRRERAPPPPTSRGSRSRPTARGYAAPSRRRLPARDPRRPRRPRASRAARRSWRRSSRTSAPPRARRPSSARRSPPRASSAARASATCARRSSRPTASRPGPTTTRRSRRGSDSCSSPTSTPARKPTARSRTVRSPSSRRPEKKSLTNSLGRPRVEGILHPLDSAQVDVDAGAIVALSAVVESVVGDAVTVDLGTVDGGTVDVLLADLATWAVPLLADGETARRAAPSAAPRVGRRAARYM